MLDEDAFGLAGLAGGDVGAGPVGLPADGADGRGAEPAGFRLEVVVGVAEAVDTARGAGHRSLVSSTTAATWAARIVALPSLVRTTARSGSSSSVKPS